MAEPLDSSNILNSLRGQADKAAGISPGEPQPTQRFAPGEGIAAGLDELLKGINEQDKTPREFIKVGKIFSDRLSNVKAFGIILGTGGAALGSKIMDYTWHHKGEIAVGAGGGALAKTAARVLLTGSGGVVPAMLIGAAGGAASGALKEYWKQRGSLEIEEAGNKLVIDGLRNEFRRIGALDRENKEKIGKAALRGAAFGAAGAILSDIAAENEWVQEQFTQMKKFIPEIKKPQLPTFTASQTGESLPAPEATPTPKPPAPTEAVKPPVAPTGVPAQEQLPATPPQAAPAVEKPQLPVKPQLPPLEAAPSASDTLTIPKGSSIWNEAKTYLENNLDHPPTNTDISNAVNKIMADNNITDARAVPAGANLNIHGVNEMIGKAAAQHIDISPELAKMPEVIELQGGSDPWQEGFKYGSSYLNKPLTNAQTLLITKELCRQSGIAVPVWGLNEGIDHTKLPVGFKLIFNDPVKKLLEELKAA